VNQDLYGYGRSYYLIVTSIFLVLGLAGCSLAPKVASPELAANIQESAGLDRLFGLIPNPDLSPDQVVRIQLQALQNNDDEDRGIEITFRFASPGNRRTTGPLNRFTVMIKTGYHFMLNYRSARYEPIEIIGHKAQQRVILYDAQGNGIVYLFSLSKQVTGDCVGCWLTDSVIIERVLLTNQEPA
jgi:hypothetical protein